MKANARTFDGLVHEVHATVINCATAWENVPEGEDKLYGKLPVFLTDEPVNCLECLANTPQPRKD